MPAIGPTHLSANAIPGEPRQYYSTTGISYIKNNQTDFQIGNFQTKPHYKIKCTWVI